MAGEQHRGALGRQAADQIPRRAPGGGVEPGRGVVEEEELGIADNPQAHVETPLLAAREGLHLGIGLLAEPNQLDDLTDRARRRVEAGVSFQHLTDREERLHGQFLQDDPELGSQPTLLVPVARVDPEHPHRAVISAHEPLEDLDRRRLSRTVGTE